MKKIISALLLLVMAMSLFAGCSNAEPEATETLPETSAATEAPAV